jgi:hypothetical protein
MLRVAKVFGVFVALVCVWAQDSAGLPIKRVVLYKNGVGYFEHLGQVRDKQDVTISFTSGQLNDVLKSLTLLDLNGGRITGVTYDSIAPASRQISDLHLPLGEKTSLTEFLAGLRGARLEVRSGAAVLSGRLLSIERKTRISGGTTLEVDYISLITDSGELRTAEVSPAFSARLLEKGLPRKIDRYLDLMSSGRAPDVRNMIVSADGSGDRSLFVSYISEVPVWKATYRIIIGKKAPLLQGWAIVDNTVGQDWRNVQLSLVAGAPQSFVQNLSTPFYSRRPTVALPESVSTAPQTYEGTLMLGGGRLSGSVADATGAKIAGARVRAYDTAGPLVGDTTANASGEYDFRALPDGPIRLEVESPGFRKAIHTGVIASSSSQARRDVRLDIGSMTETVNVEASAPDVQTSSADASVPRKSLGSGRALGGGAGAARQFSPPGAILSGISEALSRAPVAAQAKALGDLFEYKLKNPITIEKNRSALVPIVQSAISAEKVSIWNERTGLSRPQRALWLTNTSGVTLDGGSFSVLEEETFAGEGLFEPIRPDEKRLISYATDLALNVSSRIGSEQQRVARVRVHKGLMIHDREVREKKTYTFRNEDTSPRAVIVEHPVRQGFELRGDVKPIETTAAWMRFRLQVDAKQTSSLVVDEARTLSSSYVLTDLDSPRVDMFASQGTISKDVNDALRRILSHKAAIQEISTQVSVLESEKDAIFDDQQRLRENIKSLKGSAEEKALIQRYTQQLNQQETRLEELRMQTAELESKRQTAQAALDRMVQELSFDVKL